MSPLPNAMPAFLSPSPVFLTGTPSRRRRTVPVRPRACASPPTPAPAPASRATAASPSLHATASILQASAGLLSAAPLTSLTIPSPEPALTSLLTALTTSHDDSSDLPPVRLHTPSSTAPPSAHVLLTPADSQSGAVLSRRGDTDPPAAPWRPVEQAEREAHVQGMRAFVDEFVAPLGVCPHSAGADLAAVGPALRAAGVVPGGVRYVVSGAACPEAVLADVLAEAVRLLGVGEDDAATSLLALPAWGEDWETFAAFSLLLEDVLSSLAGEVSIVVFHPDYDRDVPVLPRELPLPGHLPSEPFLRSFLLRFEDETGKNCEGDFDTTFNIFEAANYARRSPAPMINILRSAHIAAADASPTPKDRIYARNARRIWLEGEAVHKDRLQGWRDALRT